MGCILYKAWAPGSLMLFGEHAVLYGKPAIVVAINLYLQVTLIPRKDRQVKITAQEFGTFKTSLDKLQVVEPYTHVLTAIQQHLPAIPYGFDLTIDTEFGSNLGFGSSAAVTVATLSVLYQWLKKHNSIRSCNCAVVKNRIFRQALKVIRAVQGIGSGADVAASVYGGVLAYQAKPLLVKQLVSTMPLVAVYSGSKVATVNVVAQVKTRNALFPKVFRSLYKALDSCTREAMVAIRAHDWRRLGVLMNVHHGLQDALGVNNKILADLVFALRQQAQIYGAKISGAGLGDCVVGLGQVPTRIFPENKEQRKRGVKQIDIGVSKVGLRCTGSGRV